MRSPSGRGVEDARHAEHAGDAGPSDDVGAVEEAGDIALPDVPVVAVRARRRIVGVVAAVVALLLVVGAAAIADGVVRDRTETRLAAGLERDVPGLEGPPEVTIGGFPFLTQALGGELQDVHVTAPAVTVDGVRLEDVDVRLQGVSTSLPTTAAEAHLSASMSLASIREQVTVPVDLAIEDRSLVASVSVLGLPLAITLAPRPAGREIEVEPVELRLAGARISADVVPDGLIDQLGGMTIPVAGLPPGLVLTDLTVEPDGVRIAAAGSDVVFEEAVPGADA